MAQADVVTLIFRAPILVLSGFVRAADQARTLIKFFLGDKTKNGRVISRGGKNLGSRGDLIAVRVPAARHTQKRWDQTLAFLLNHSLMSSFHPRES